MEVREIIHHPHPLNPLIRISRLQPRSCRRLGAKNHHIQTTRGRIVEPAGGEGADAVQGGEVDMFGGDEVVFGRGAEVGDVVGEERVGEGVWDQKDEVRASSREGVGELGTNAACAAL